MNHRNDLIDHVLAEIQNTLITGQFQDIERSFIELKDLSTGQEWTSLKQTICAFLNTKGGYVICGIREKNQQYKLTGFDRNNEGRLIELRAKVFKNDQDAVPDLSDNIDLDYREVLGKTLAVVTVRPLSEDLKFLKFDQVYYERVLTQDKTIPQAKLIQHKEYKAELEYAKEISPVANATIQDLDVNKINQFIIKINVTGKKETVKKDLPDAASFLARRYCLNADGAVTVLGLLLFGREPSQFLENRARLDCYFETDNQIGRDKKYFDDDILNLMDDAFAFVWGHIQVGRSAVGGGRSEPEYPTELIRETINNALAHRDYTANQFVTIKVNPGKNIEIKNPGGFKQKMLLTDLTGPTAILRIIPGLPESRNPKLANVLKTLEKIESQGIGMATLVGVCLDNLIDVPYYDLSAPGLISLVIPSGRLVDEQAQWWINSFRGYLSDRLNRQPTQADERILTYLYKSELLNRRRLYTILLGPSNNHLEALAALQQAGLILAHPSASSGPSPVYVVARELTLSDFTPQIEAQTQQSLADLDQVAKIVLHIVYRYDHYNRQSLKPNLITPELYARLYGKAIDPTTYESLGRKVRKICRELTERGLLTRKADKSYVVAKHLP